MDLYHSRLTQDDLNDLVIKYKIPCDIHPRLPSEEFVMSELLDDAIALEELVLLIDRRAISDSMVWRHPSAAIDDPRPAVGSFSMADVRRLSAHVGAYGNVIGIHDFLCLPEWTGAEVQEEPHLDVRPTLQRLPFYCTPPAAADAVIPDPTLEDLAVGTPSSKILAKAEAFRAKGLYFCTTRPSLFVGDDDDESDDDDDDACVEIPLVTPLYFAAVIPSSGNQCGSSATPVAKGSNPRDSRGKGIMVDDDAAPSVGVNRPRPSSRPVPSFRDVSGDAIHMDFFPFYAGPYLATYPKGGIAGNCEFTHEEWDAPYRPTFEVLTKEVFKDLAICKTVVDQFPTPGEMVQVESLSNDQLTAKMSVLHGMMMSHGGELLARYHGLVQSYHEYVLSANSRLKGYEDKSKAKGKESKKKIKSLTKSMDNLHAEVACLSADLNRATILEAKKDEEILCLKDTPLDARFERGLSMHQTKDEFAAVLKKMANFMPSVHYRIAEASLLVAQTDYAFINKISKHAIDPLLESTVTPASKSLELSTNVAPASFVVILEKNEEWGTSHVLDDAAEVTVVGSELVSSSITDVVVALAAGEKGDGSLPSSVVDEEAAANPFGV
ncbi:hypothetical protein Tco_0611467 [Tanacetum coccineum]